MKTRLALTGFPRKSLPVSGCNDRKKNIHLVRIGLIIALLSSFALSVACDKDTREERENESRNSQAAKSAVAPDGSIHLTAAQIQSNGIQTSPAIKQQVTATLAEVGVVQARSGGEAVITAPFAGRLIGDAKRIPHVGVMVKRGEVVAELEQNLAATDRTQFSAQDVQLQAAIVQAEHEVDLRRTELERAKRLYEGGAVPLKQVQTAEFNLKQAEATQEAAKAGKAKLDALLSQQGTSPRLVPLSAPISGTVITADLVPGSQIDAGKSLMTIVDLSTVWVAITVHENEIPPARHAEQVTITTPAYPDRTYSGAFVTISGVVDPANRTATIIYAVENHDASLKVGMTAEAKIPLGATVSAVLIPASAVLLEEAQAFVFVETEPGVYQRRTVTTGERNDGNIAVLSGLTGGEKVVSIGAASLRSESMKGQLSADEEGER